MVYILQYNFTINLLVISKFTNLLSKLLVDMQWVLYANNLLILHL